MKSREDRLISMSINSIKIPVIPGTGQMRGIETRIQIVIRLVSCHWYCVA